MPFESLYVMQSIELNSIKCVTFPMSSALNLFDPVHRVLIVDLGAQVVEAKAVLVPPCIGLVQCSAGVGPKDTLS